MEELQVRRNSLFQKVKWELETAKKVLTRNPPLCEVRERVDRLHRLGDAFFAVQGEIEDRTTDLEAIASVFNYRTEFEERYYEAKAMYIQMDEGSVVGDDVNNESNDNLRSAVTALLEAQRVLMSNQAVVSTQTSALTAQLEDARLHPVENRPAAQAQSLDLLLNVRLPPINIPTFKGNRKEWRSFKDLFISTIHSKQSLRDSQKLQYLLSYLDGEAKSLVSSFAITDANYKQVWDKLLDRYDQNKYTVFSLVKEFLEQPVVTSANPTSLRRLVTTSDEVIRQLSAMGAQYESRDPWLIHLLLEKLDKESRAQWAAKLVDLQDPTFAQFLKFLENRCDALETCSSFLRPSTAYTDTMKKEFRKEQSKPLEKRLQSFYLESQLCPKCSSDHQIYQCESFKASSVADRRELVQKSKLCFNCLRPSHSVKNCSSKTSCKNSGCNQRHHTLLCQHGDSQEATSVQKPTIQSACSSPASELPEQEVHSTDELSSFKTELSSSGIPHKVALLPTALIKVRDNSGTFQIARAMIDSCSGASLISEACVTRLGLSRSNARFAVTGVAGSAAGTTKGAVRLEISSRFNDEVVLTTEAYVLEVLTSPMPNQSIDGKRMKFLEAVPLADPTFWKTGKIDVILGVELFLPMLRMGQITDENGLPIAQNSVFGWLVAGRFDGGTSIETLCASLSVDSSVNIDKALRMFWETEEMPSQKVFTADEIRAAEIFNTTHHRNESGRFVVRLPFDETKPALGESLTAAVKRLHAMERKFLVNPTFKQQYGEFMEDYLRLGHMEPVPESEIAKSPCECFYLPHHAVQKEDSSTTKLRVVFDGSCRSSSGISLNDRLLVGPNNTESLLDVLSRFRTYPVVFTSDVEKMYRQVQISKDQVDYQRIVYRKSPEDPVQHYRLLTVTYGTSCAAYLATESLRQAARDSATEFPEAADRIVKGFYVDDLMSGARTLEEARKLVSEISTIMESSGFVLRKWSSNVPELIENIADSRQGPIPLQFTSEVDSVKALGIHWSPKEDSFNFKVSLDVTSCNTKRQLLSDASKLFDPFGWLSPCIVKIKILFQQLWLHDLTWDDPLPAAIEEEWVSTKNNLHMLEQIRIPRWIANHGEKMQLIGFSDASELAYAAVVYGRSVDSNGQINVTLIAAKTKVAPIQQVTLPRLELNAAVLLTTLMKKISSALSHLDLDLYAWTDSTVVLEWLSSHPRKWKTYVANRTATILDVLPRSSWHHVTSGQNPADCASRGVSPCELLEHTLWWTGPSWLYNQTQFNDHLTAGTPICEASHQVSVFNTNIAVGSNFIVEQYLLDRFSSISRMSRVLAAINRFVANMKAVCSKDKCKTGPISPDELQAATLGIIRFAQQDKFDKDLTCLRSGTELPRKSKLRSLHPFIDKDGTLRVGGRLQNADLPYEMKHPVILPSDHRCTKVIMLDTHLANLHAGPSLLVATLNQRYWILRCQTAARQIVHNCIRCCRMKAKTATQLMGSLPAVRTMPVRAFVHVGVDYAGPIIVKSGNPRKPLLTKGYIVVFVCLSTKAVHLEAASDLSTAAFIDSLKRFIARRGLCTEIWSDNGTNFVGADRQMQEFFQSVEFKNRAERFSSNVGIKWTFIPPSAPHVGGLWEAAVKSAKLHLYKVLSRGPLTYEDLYTILTQVEACLNSRPLCAMSNSPDDYNVLTPGHFIIGQPMNLLPEPSVPSVPINRLDSWKVLQKQVEDIWQRWRNEYVSSLQPRAKWQETRDNLEVNRLVLVKNENTPPAQWELARVVSVHPDRYGVVRTVTLRRGSSEYQRPIQKLVPLPSV